MPWRSTCAESPGHHSQLLSPFVWLWQPCLRMRRRAAVACAISRVVAAAPTAGLAAGADAAAHAAAAATAAAEAAIDARVAATATTAVTAETAETSAAAEAAAEAAEAAAAETAAAVAAAAAAAAAAALPPSFAAAADTGARAALHQWARSSRSCIYARALSHDRQLWISWAISAISEGQGRRRRAAELGDSACRRWLR
eukprot:2915856-Pleurochrysis_carterae.AAC.2